jgi:hypothetical protein
MISGGFFKESWIELDVEVEQNKKEYRDEDWTKKCCCIHIIFQTLRAFTSDNPNANWIII